MALIQSTAIPSGATDYELEQSLKFNDDDSAYLSWTPSSAGNRRTYTWSGWVKRANQGSWMRIFSANSPQDYIAFTNANRFIVNISGDRTGTDAQLFRDSSSFYHIVVAVDTTQSTASNRVKIYFNGLEISDYGNGEGGSTAEYPNQNYEGGINNTTTHRIGAEAQGTASNFLDGYLAEVNFIDGQALTPADFGKTGDYGEWKPIEYSGTYGTNGFYLPFKQDYTVEGFSTVLWKGTDVPQYIGGVGFQPDMLWVKSRTSAHGHVLVDSLRGNTQTLIPNATDAEYGSSMDTIDAFSSDGFTVGADGGTNSNGASFVAWNWDMGGSNATNTDGSITSTVRANTTYGQSIVSYTGNATAGATVGHGLSSAPEMIILKDRDGTTNWSVYHASNTAAPETEALALNTTDATSDYLWWNDTAPTNSLFSLGAISNTNASGNDFIAYCFHSVTGYSKFGSYSGTGSSGNSVTTGFAPAFLLTKRTDSSDHWRIVDNVRSPTNVGSKVGLKANASDNESDSGSRDVDFTSTGFTVNTTDPDSNASGGTYIYMAFADKREYAYWLDQSGNNNDWTSNNLTESDISVDSPTNNFATFSPLMLAVNMGTELSEGNLKNYEGSTHSGYPHNSFSTMSVTSGKWYFEVRNTLAYGAIGICNLSDSGVNQLANSTASPVTNMPSDGEGWAFKNGNGNKEHNNSNVSYGSAITSNDVVMCAFDVDAGKIWWGVNGTWIASGNPATAANPAYTGEDFGNACPVVTTENGSTAIINFGQDSSFSGNKTAQGNQDGNGIGDFYYTPPTGFLALCTKNLPDVAVVPSEHFNTVLYSGNGATSHAITGVGFQPDFNWIKRRNSTNSHVLHDSVRGKSGSNYLYLHSNSTNAEAVQTDEDGVSSFNSDGFTVGYNGSGIWNNSSGTYVSWNWKANGSGSSNTNGTITSTVSANTDAGFSIVKWVGNEGSDESIGHGLSKAPEMILTWVRDEAWGNQVYHKDMGTNKKMMISETTAAETDTDVWADTAPTSSVFYVGTDLMTNWDDRNYIGYCFHSVDGYSSMGSFTGNGSTDGTFVYTGFRPAFVMVKRTNTAENWGVWDNKRDGYNLTKKFLIPSLSNAEQDGSQSLDLTSNGFKWRTGDAINNASGDSYIFLAFAETPFKYSNAR